MNQDAAVALALAGVLRVEVDGVGVEGQRAEVEEEPRVRDETEARLCRVGRFWFGVRWD